MFQSISYPSRSEGEGLCLTDSKFGTILGNGYWIFPGGVELIITEYGKRKLNVAFNLIRYFQWYEERFGFEFGVSLRIKHSQAYYPHLFTPELNQQLEKYLLLL